MSGRKLREGRKGLVAGAEASGLNYWLGLHRTRRISADLFTLVSNACGALPGLKCAVRPSRLGLFTGCSSVALLCRTTTTANTLVPFCVLKSLTGLTLGERSHTEEKTTSAVDIGGPKKRSSVDCGRVLLCQIRTGDDGLAKSDKGDVGNLVCKNCGRFHG